MRGKKKTWWCETYKLNQFSSVPRCMMYLLLLLLQVYIGINSLSTDFSSQKGVKGLPLNIQVDTYDFSSGTNHLIHRAACQVKIFCDKVSLLHHFAFIHTHRQTRTEQSWIPSRHCNCVTVRPQGAERKMRDEERKRGKRRGKTTDANGEGCKRLLRPQLYRLQTQYVECLTWWTSLHLFPATKSVVSSSIGSDYTFFKTIDDHVTQPVLFIPETHLSSLQRMVGPTWTVLPCCQ